MTGKLRRLKLLSSQAGMTLLEIMIVLVILGGLIGILATSVQGSLKKAKIRQAKILIAEVGKALDMYYTDCNQYPTAEENLNALLTAPASCTNWGPDPYVKHLSKDPWGSDLVYEPTGSGYVLKSLGSDKREGGEGDAKDITSE